MRQSTRSVGCLTRVSSTVSRGARRFLATGVEPVEAIFWRRALRTTETLAGDQSGSKDVGSHNLRGDAETGRMTRVRLAEFLPRVHLGQWYCFKLHSIFPVSA